jgi:hypothetical protein
MGEVEEMKTKRLEQEEEARLMNTEDLGLEKK